MKNILVLRKIGWDKAGYANGSDLPNPRLRANLLTLDGLEVCVDFGGYQRRAYTPKCCPIVQPNALHIDGCYYDEDGCGRDYAYKLKKSGFDFTKYDFTKAGILAFVNTVTSGNYTDFKFI